MSGRRALVPALGVIGVGAGYYLYQAGGNPKVAEKKFEHDAARLSSSTKSELPGKGKEIKTEAKVLGEQAGAKLDDALGQTKAAAHDFDSKASRYAADAQKSLEARKQEASKDINSAINKFDKTVEQKAAEVSHKVSENAEKAKGGLSSWFGGK